MDKGIDSIKLSEQMLPHIQIYNHLNKELWDWINDSVGFGADRMGEPMGRGISAAAGESVSVNIAPECFVNNMKYNILKEGDFIRFTGKKRIWGEVTKIITANTEELKFNTKAIYRPAPKSRLNNTRTPFSKMQLKIVKLYSTTP